MICKRPGCDREAAPRHPNGGAVPVYCGPGCRTTGMRVSPEKRWAYKLTYKYGVSVAQYDQLMAKQGGACCICGTSGPEAARWGKLVVDHDHATGKVRGLLCSNCNCALGLLGDSPEALEKAARYLRATTDALKGV